MVEWPGEEKKKLVENACFGILRGKGIFLKVVGRGASGNGQYVGRMPWHDLIRSRNQQLATRMMTMEVGGLCEVMSRVMGFGRHAEMMEPAHLRQAMTQGQREDRSLREGGVSTLRS
jgi:hypothetical protein